MLIKEESKSSVPSGIEKRESRFEREYLFGDRKCHGRRLRQLSVKALLAITSSLFPINFRI